MLGWMKHKLESRLPGEISITSVMQMLLLLLSGFSRVWLCATPETVAHQAPPSLEFSRQEFWNGLPTLMAESKEELKSLLMKVKEKSEKAGLELSIQKMKIMASGPITLWQIDGENVETVSDFIYLGSKITADGDCSHEIKRCLLLERKAMRNITLPTKVCLVKAMVFPVVMYGCESWTIKKAECRRIDAFDLWCWRKLLRVP